MKIPKKQENQQIDHSSDIDFKYSKCLCRKCISKNSFLVTDNPLCF